MVDTDEEPNVVSGSGKHERSSALAWSWAALNFISY